VIFQPLAIEFHQFVPRFLGEHADIRALAAVDVCSWRLEAVSFYWPNPNVCFGVPLPYFGGDSKGDQSGLLTLIGVESVSLCVPMNC
jgi:hypothetical protein